MSKQTLIVERGSVSAQKLDELSAKFTIVEYETGFSPPVVVNTP